MQRLHGKGLGTKEKQAEPITPDEEAILWACGQMGWHSAQVQFVHAVHDSVSLASTLLYCHLYHFLQ